MVQEPERLLHFIKVQEPERLLDLIKEPQVFGPRTLSSEIRPKKDTVGHSSSSTAYAVELGPQQQFSSPVDNRTPTNGGIIDSDVHENYSIADRHALAAIKLKLELAKIEREQQKEALQIKREEAALKKEEQEREAALKERETALHRERERVKLETRKRHLEMQREHDKKQGDMALACRQQELTLETTHHTQRQQATASLPVSVNVSHANKCGKAQYKSYSETPKPKPTPPMSAEVQESDEVSPPVLVTTRAQAARPQPAASTTTAVPQDPQNLPPNLTMLDFRKLQREDPSLTPLFFQAETQPDSIPGFFLENQLLYRSVFCVTNTEDTVQHNRRITPDFPEPLIKQPADG
ncbi:putative uncharacterized protein DDB_G0271982 [Procambarus clarkii]|uniref:putative uncharacterized protein DDB_G0271982 n=1 Tax=Procambarus clarkii TaxID=6728 RepID=UPI003742E376